MRISALRRDTTLCNALQHHAMQSREFGVVRNMQVVAYQGDSDVKGMAQARPPRAASPL